MTTPTFSRQAFEDVASFLPLFGANSFDFGTWVVRQGSFPFVTYHPDVGRFVRTLERHGWVYESPDFLWGPWLRTPEAQGLMSGETLGQATPDQLARLLTVFARQERIVDGSRLEMYQSGLLLAILRRVQEYLQHLPWQADEEASQITSPKAQLTALSPSSIPTTASLPAQRHPSSSLTFAEAARRVHEFIGQFEEGYFPPLLMLARLTEETGEIARVLAHQNGKKPKPGEPAGDLEMELADLLFVAICMANERGLSLERGFTRMMDKIERRDRERWTRKVDLVWEDLSALTDSEEGLFAAISDLPQRGQQSVEEPVVTPEEGRTELEVQAPLPSREPLQVQATPTVSLEVLEGETVTVSALPGAVEGLTTEPLLVQTEDTASRSEAEIPKAETPPDPGAARKEAESGDVRKPAKAIANRKRASRK